MVKKNLNVTKFKDQNTINKQNRITRPLSMIFKVKRINNNAQLV